MSLARAAAAPRSTVPLLLALFSLPVLASWWWLMRDQLTASGVDFSAMPVTPDGMAWVSVITRVACWAGEAAAYVVVWRAVGERLPWWRYALALAPLSALDVCADSLRLHADAFGEGARHAIAALGGIGVLGPWDGEWQLLGSAFAATGILTFARIAGAAAIQSRLARVPWRAAFALTLGLWLVHHVALWWALELTAGRSLPAGGGS